MENKRKVSQIKSEASNKGSKHFPSLFYVCFLYKWENITFYSFHNPYQWEKQHGVWEMRKDNRDCQSESFFWSRLNHNSREFWCDALFNAPDIKCLCYSNFLLSISQVHCFLLLFKSIVNENFCKYSYQHSCFW